LDHPVFAEYQMVRLLDANHGRAFRSRFDGFSMQIRVWTLALRIVVHVPAFESEATGLRSRAVRRSPAKGAFGERGADGAFKNGKAL
jgi:hypothetical protein